MYWTVFTKDLTVPRGVMSFFTANQHYELNNPALNHDFAG